MADHVDPAKRSLMMAAVHSKDTGPEMAVRRMVHRLGYRFRLHRRDLPGTPDIVFPSRKSVMFIHGCFWHGHDCRRGSLPSTNVEFWQRKIEKNQTRDGQTQELLRKQGWKVLTVWECEMKNAGRLVKKLRRFLDCGNKEKHMVGAE